MIRGGTVVLSVDDVAGAVRFYVETLGMKLVEEADDGSAVIDAGEGFRIGLHKGEGRTGAAGPAVTLHTKVPLEEAIAIYENRGVVFTREPLAATSPASARFQDPDGNVLYLVG